MKRKEYIIEFNKVRNGDNTYVFQLHNEFLEAMGTNEYGKVDVVANILVTKTENMYTVKANFSGTAEVVCDICLDEFSYPVNGNYGFIIKQSEVEKYDDDEIIYITPVTIEFDLSQFLFDSFVLSIPYKKTCSLVNKKCNAEVMAKLDKMKQDLEKENGPDPRWEKLSGMKDDSK